MPSAWLQYHHAIDSTITSLRSQEGNYKGSSPNMGKYFHAAQEPAVGGGYIESILFTADKKCLPPVRAKKAVHLQASEDA